MVRATSARPSGARREVPAKMTSSILPPRRLLAPCSPMTQARASTTLDLPEPFGPTTQVIPGSKRRVVDDANDLKPRRVRLFRCTVAALLARVGEDRGQPTRPRRKARTGAQAQRSGERRLAFARQREQLVLRHQGSQCFVRGAQTLDLVLEVAGTPAEPGKFGHDDRVRAAKMSEQGLRHRGSFSRSR